MNVVSMWKGEKVKIVPRVLMLSIHPQYAEKILDGTKTVELRRTRAKISEGDVLLFYASSPVKALKIVARVGRVDWLETDELWGRVKQTAGISRTEFESYFDGATMGLAIHMRNVYEPVPIPLAGLKVLWPGFKPPQLYKYLTGKQFSALLSLYCFILSQLYAYEILLTEEQAKELRDTLEVARRKMCGERERLELSRLSMVRSILTKERSAEKAVEFPVWNGTPYG